MFPFRLALLVTYFCGTCLLALDGFDQHFQASFHYPQTSNMDKSQQHHNKLPGTPRIEPGAAGSEARMLPLFHAPTKSPIFERAT